MKKSQAFSNIIMWLIVGVFVLFMLLFGLKAIANIGKQQCNADFSMSEVKLKSFSDSISMGERKGIDIKAPCDSEYAFAVDIKKKDVVKESFSDIPFLKMRIENGNENFFIINEKEVVSAMNIPDLYVSYPYYECYKLDNGKLSLSVEGSGYNKIFAQKDPRYDCTFEKSYSLGMDEKDKGKFCKKIEGCSGENEKVKTNRTIKEEDGKLKITIDITADEELKNFDYFEELPKCVSEGLATELIVYGLDGQLGKCEIEKTPLSINLKGCELISNPSRAEDSYGPKAIIKFTDFIFEIRNPDPLMVWHFTNQDTNSEQIIYELNNLQQQITSDCIRDLRGIAADVVIKRETAPALGESCSSTGPTCAADFQCINGYCRKSHCSTNSFSTTAKDTCYSDPFGCGLCNDVSCTDTIGKECASGYCFNFVCTE